MGCILLAGVVIGLFLRSKSLKRVAKAPLAVKGPV